MKKIIFFISLILLVSSIFIYTHFAPSYNVYREAKALYDKGEYRKAYKKVKEAMKIDQLNRKAILLQAKLHKIITSEDNYNAALKAYRDSMKSFFEEDYPKAILKITESYDLLDKIPKNAPIYEKAMELKLKVDREIDNIQKKLPSLYYKKAQKLVKEKRYVAAYEFLSQIEKPTPEIISLKNEIAYKIGTNAYAKIISNSEKASKIEISDAIYWLSKVEKTSPSYKISQKQIKILKQFLTSSEK